MRCSIGGRNLLVISLRVSSRMSALVLRYSTALLEFVLVLRAVGAGMKRGPRGGASRPSCPAGIGRGITRSIFPVFIAVWSVLSSAILSFPLRLRRSDSLGTWAFTILEIFPFRCSFGTAGVDSDVEIFGSFSGKYDPLEFALEMIFSCFCAAFFSCRS